MGDYQQCPGHNSFIVGGVIFSSSFDNGNLLKVEQVKGESDYTYNIWSANDNHGTQYQSRNCFWFHFSISGVPVGTKLKFYIITASTHITLYKHDMRPVYKAQSNNNEWKRLKNPVKFERSSDGTLVSFEHVVEGIQSNHPHAHNTARSSDEGNGHNNAIVSHNSVDADVKYFAFTYPYSYHTLINELDALNHSNVCFQRLLYYRQITQLAIYYQIVLKTL